MNSEKPLLPEPYFTGNDNSGLFCIETGAFPVGMVVFGASGDLAFRKIIPALYNLRARSLLPQNFFLLGVGRSGMTSSDFQERACQSIEAAADSPAAKHQQNSEECNFETDRDILMNFVQAIDYISLDYSSAEDYRILAARIEKLSLEFGTKGNLLFYLAVPPSLFKPIVSNLSGVRLLKNSKADSLKRQEENPNGSLKPFSRVIIEKPFGHDSRSAQILSEDLIKYVDESSILRIDHYLGKETVQNILMLRFANTIFEPVWNRHYIDHVQITVAEEIGVGHRAGFYEENGLLRDMFQNHMLQILSLVAMEPPSSFQADRIRDEKFKVLQSASIARYPDGRLMAVTGQYTSGNQSANFMAGYREEDGVKPDSDTETYAAAVINIDNWRWKGVPFMLRSGKRLSQRATQVAIVFKPIPHSIFCPDATLEHPRNMLIMDIQPKESFHLIVNGKIPGPKLCMSTMSMSFDYDNLVEKPISDAYERLILDAILGDQTLFVRHDNLMAAWNLLDPLLESLSVPNRYKAGSWGPDEADKLAESINRKWLKPGRGK